ncbi:MAG: DNA gyrase C-terminal beta-propeller domain-containing protein, partial [Myxococcota bacterium]|nr:DNA gyrase C-terminal beta-propeller domain-containing protein [Myxococcota bacterium]
EHLLPIRPGPAVPRGGVISGPGAPVAAAPPGRGLVRVRGVAELEKDHNGEDKAIVITEIPYQVNKSRLVENIAKLVRDKRIEGIRDLRDESDRSGMRIYIELKRDAIGQIVINHLFKHTALQSTFGVINLALVAGRPQVLNLKEILGEFIAHRKEVTLRRCRYELNQAEARAHIVEGYLKALDVIDEIIAIIRGSNDTEIARNALIETFAFTHVQAQAILDMRLGRLTGMEREKLQAEAAELAKIIERLGAILGSEQLVAEVIKDELLQIKGRYADPRRTRIVAASADLSIEDLIADEDVAVTFSHLGYVKRTPLREYRAQKRGGTGRRGMSTRDEDFVRDLFVARTHDRLMIFTTMGRVYLMPVYEVPEGGPAARGRPIVNLVSLQEDEEVSTVFNIREFDERSLVMVTEGGMIKRTKLSDYKNIRTNGIIACSLKDEDKVLTVRLLEDEEQSVLLATAHGKAIHFPASQAREMGRTARGVIGVQLVGDDRLVGVEIIQPERNLLTITENGFGKRTPISEYRQQRRGGIGLIDIKTEGRNGSVVGVTQVEDGDQLIIVTSAGKVIRTRVDEVSMRHRNTLGVTLIKLDKKEQVVAFSRLSEDQIDSSPEEEETIVDENFHPAEEAGAEAPAAPEATPEAGTEDEPEPAAEGDEE